MWVYRLEAFLSSWKRVLAIFRYLDITVRIISSLQFWQKINGQTSKFARKLHFLGIRKVLNLGLKAEKPLQNENHTEDWALGTHPRDNGHVTHYT